MTTSNKSNPSSSEEQQTPSSVFIFPKDDLSSRVEIPFSFQDPSQSSQDSSNSSPSQFHSFIKIQNTPTLYLDISDETNQEKLICDALKTENVSLTSTLSKCETTLQNVQTENDKLKNELVALKNEFLIQNHQLTLLNEQMQKNEVNFINQMKIQRFKLDSSDQAIKTLLSKFDKIEQSSRKPQTLSYEEYLNKKFDLEQCDDTTIYKNLTKDLLDFTYMNEMLQKAKILQINQIIQNLKEIVHCNCDIKLYGSYLTGLALPWSDIDLMLIKLDDEAFTKASYMTFIQTLFIKLKSATWIKMINLIDDIPLLPKLKIDTDNDISIYLCVVSMSTNNFIKSGEIINQYSHKYEGIFTPMILALKQILFNSHLISNYNNNINLTGGISSYALSILVISYLNSISSSLETKSLGKVFLDFIKFFGFQFDNSITNNPSPNQDISSPINNKIFFTTENIPPIVLNYYTNAVNNGSCELVIIDPCDSKLNLAEKTFRFSNIKLAFMIGYNIAKDNCECSCHYKGNICTEEKEHCLLNKIFKTVKRFTPNNPY